MPCQLNIRNNLEAAADVFGVSDVHSFDRGPVRIGSSPQVECPIADSQVAETHAELREATDGAGWSVRPLGGHELFVNNEPVSADCALCSGDEIRIGHWTLRFRRVHPGARRARHADMLSLLTKLLVVLILLIETCVVVWLPRRLKSATLWELDIARQRTLMAIDHLRSLNRRAEPASELEKHARSLLAGELNACASYARANDKLLTREQWRALHNDVNAYNAILARFRNGTAWHPVPTFDMKPAVAAMLDRAVPPEED